MKYMLMIYGNQQTWASLGKEQWAEGIAAQDAFNRRFFDTGELLGAYGLGDSTEAKVVRVNGGVPAVTDGPYLESKEFLASYYLLDCASEARALEIAAEMPFASVNGVEVWPVRHEGQK